MISKHVFSTIVSIPIMLVLKYLSELMPYTRQGFFCDDDEIRFPYREDSVPSRSMQVAFVVVGSLLFIASEYSLIRHLTRKNRRLIVRGVHPFIYSNVFLLASYVLSLLATNTSTTLAKKTMCRLRPNFLAVCQPNLTLYCPPGSHVFVENYECLGRFLDDEYYSFPSGHSSSAANFAVFFIIYLQRRCKFHEVIRGFLQFLIFLFAVFVMMSRVRDYKHRLTDVIGGGALGAMFACFFVVHVLRNFRGSRYEIREGDAEDDDEESQKTTVIRGHINQPALTISRPPTKSGPSSEYGSLEDDRSYVPI